MDIWKVIQFLFLIVVAGFISTSPSGLERFYMVSLILQSILAAYVRTSKILVFYYISFVVLFTSVTQLLVWIWPANYSFFDLSGKLLGAEVQYFEHMLVLAILCVFLLVIYITYFKDTDFRWLSSISALVPAVCFLLYLYFFRYSVGRYYYNEMMQELYYVVAFGLSAASGVMFLAIYLIQCAAKKLRFE